MLLHAAHRWPKTITANLWPQAIKHAVNIRNALPRDGRNKSPLSLFSNTTVEPNLKHFHPFGCPVYVLEAPLQNRNPYPKWDEQTRVGIFLCHSPDHASSAPLVLNTQTGLVSPQFHCVYNNTFDMVHYNKYNKSLWQIKTKLQENNTTADDDQLVTEPIPKRLQQSRILRAQTFRLPSFAFRTPSCRRKAKTTHHNNQRQTERLNKRSNNKHNKTTHRRHKTLNPREQPPRIRSTLPPSGQTCSGRRVGPPSRFASYAERCAESMHPLATLVAFAGTKFKDPDPMTLEEALRQPNRDQFIEAMGRELAEHHQRKHWKVVSQRQVPRFRKPIPMVWSMKRKRDPTGEIIKWKARLCAGGHKQVYGNTYWDTYTPVVSWSTVRLIFILALILGWHMHSINFVMAYTQAEVKPTS